MTPNYAGPPGRIVEKQNVYVNSGPAVVAGTVEDPGLSYSYTLDNPANVKAIVLAGAGTS